MMRQYMMLGETMKTYAPLSPVVLMICFALMGNVLIAQSPQEGEVGPPYIAGLSGIQGHNAVGSGAQGQEKSLDPKRTESVITARTDFKLSTGGLKPGQPVLEKNAIATLSDVVRAGEATVTVVSRTGSKTFVLPKVHDDTAVCVQDDRTELCKMRLEVFRLAVPEGATIDNLKAGVTFLEDPFKDQFLDQSIPFIFGELMVQVASECENPIVSQLLVKDGWERKKPAAPALKLAEYPQRPPVEGEGLDATLRPRIEPLDPIPGSFYQRKVTAALENDDVGVLVDTPGANLARMSAASLVL
jgi:hypothetical protein